MFYFAIDHEGLLQVGRGKNVLGWSEATSFTLSQSFFSMDPHLQNAQKKIKSAQSSIHA